MAKFLAPDREFDWTCGVHRSATTNIWLSIQAYVLASTISQTNRRLPVEILPDLGVVAVASIDTSRDVQIVGPLQRDIYHLLLDEMAADKSSRTANDTFWPLIFIEAPFPRP